MTFFNGTAVAFFAIFDDAVAAGAEVFQLDFFRKKKAEGEIIGRNPSGRLRK